MTNDNQPVAQCVGGTPFHPVCKVVTATEQATEDIDESST